MNPESARDLGYHTQLLFPARRFKESELKGFVIELEQRGVAHNRSAFQDNYAELSQTDSGSDEVTTTVIKPDRLVLAHDNVQKEGLVIFEQKLEILVKAFMEKLGVPVITNQVHTVRKLVTPKTSKDSRVFLLEKVCGLEADRRKVLNRPLHGAGLRLCFPIVDRQDPFEFDVKVESYLRDPSLLYLQNQGKFHLPVVPQNLAALSTNLNRTSDFLSQEVASFLVQFNEDRV